VCRGNGDVLSAQGGTQLPDPRARPKAFGVADACTIDVGTLQLIVRYRRV